MYTRPLFTHRPEAEYRRVIKGRLKYWRKAANLSQAQAGKLAGVARSTWQAWEDPARGALPDLAALSAVADACRIEPGAALEWLVTEHRAQETAPAAAPMIGGGGLRIEANGFLFGQRKAKSACPALSGGVYWVWSMRTARKGAGA